jgi:hypothetical protein
VAFIGRSPERLSFLGHNSFILLYFYRQKNEEETTTSLKDHKPSEHNPQQKPP